MNNMCFYLIIVRLILSYHVLCNAISVLEGDVAKLEFPYPCDSTEVTLQLSNGSPFYKSANPEHNALMPSRYDLRNHKESDSGNCFLNLTISPVSGYDEGTFILFVHKDGVMLPYYLRIRLNVDYPPGKGSCELSSDYYRDGDLWVSLRCTAPLGTIPGQIVCYQDDMRLPSLASPEENGDTLNQIILARLAGLVYCCTSNFQKPKDRCECDDFRWNPIQNTELSNIQDPCTVATETTDQNSRTDLIQQEQENNTIYPSLDPETSKNARVSSKWCHGFIATTCLMALGYIPLIYFLYKARKENNQLKKQSDTRNENEPNEQHELN